MPMMRQVRTMFRLDPRRTDAQNHQRTSRLSLLSQQLAHRCCAEGCSTSGGAVTDKTGAETLILKESFGELLVPS
jgi:hypothetical protein